MAIFLIVIIGLVLVGGLVLFWNKPDTEGDNFAQLFNEEQYELLLQKTHSALSENPNAYRAAYFAAMACEKQTNVLEALSFYEQVMEISHFDEEILPENIYRKVAELRSMLGKTQEEFEGYLNFLKLMPKDADALKKLAFLSAGSGAFKVAIGLFERYLELSSEDYKARSAYAILLYEMKSDKAYDEMKMALELSGGKVDFEVYLILIGRKNNPQETQSRIQKIFPSVNDDFIRRLLIRITIHMTAISIEAGNFLKAGYDFLVGCLTANLPMEILNETKYFLMLLNLARTEFETGFRYLNELEDVNISYRDLPRIRKMADNMNFDISPDGSGGVKDILRDEVYKMFPDKLLYKISNLKLENEVDVLRYFNEKAGKYELKPSFMPLNSETAVSRLQGMGIEELKKLAPALFRWLQYREIEEILITFDFLHFICENRKGKKISCFIKIGQPAESVKESLLEELAEKMKADSSSSAVLATTLLFSPEIIKKAENYRIRLLSRENLFHILLGYDIFN